MKPYAESCDQNRDPILGVISHLFAQSAVVLEIGSGTGQHAVYFAGRMPHLIWQTSDKAEYHPGIRMWLQDSGLPNVAAPLLLDVSQTHWPVTAADSVFSANTAHIMHWAEVEAMIRGVGRLCPPREFSRCMDPSTIGAFIPATATRASISGSSHAIRKVASGISRS